MEKTETVVDSRGVRRRNYNTSENGYRRRTRSRSRRREEKYSSFYNSMMIRIALCVLIGGIGSIIFSSGSEKAEALKTELSQALSENISFDDLKDLGKSFKSVKDKSLNELGIISDDIEIESDYIDEMNSKEDFYENQKK